MHQAANRVVTAPRRSGKSGDFRHSPAPNGTSGTVARLCQLCRFKRINTAINTAKAARTRPHIGKRTATSAQSPNSAITVAYIHLMSPRMSSRDRRQRRGARRGRHTRRPRRPSLDRGFSGVLFASLPPRCRFLAPLCNALVQFWAKTLKVDLQHVEHATLRRFDRHLGG